MRCLSVNFGDQKISKFSSVINEVVTKYRIVSFGTSNKTDGTKQTGKVPDIYDRPCGLVATVPEFPSSISDATRFFLRIGGSGTGSTKLRETN
jgi:hypothetical protein